MKKIFTLLAAILLLGNLKTANAAPDFIAKQDTTPAAHDTTAGVAINNVTSSNTDVSDSTVPTNDESKFVGTVAHWYYSHLNYGTVTLLMGIESSFIPFPSEIIIPPAAWAACDEKSSLHTTDSKFVNILFIIIFATIGAIFGALINYYLSLFLGRPIIYWFADSKIGHLLMLSSNKIKKAEDYFLKHGKSSTLIGRLVPGIRQLISIPAGLAKMPILPFIGYTALGATAWNIILALIGYILHGNKELIDQYMPQISAVLITIGVGFVVYLIIMGIINKKKNKNETQA